MRRILGAAMALAMLAGCVSSGTRTDPRVVSSFRKGVTTISQAEAQLGQPNNVIRNADGSTVLQYIYVHAAANGASYIPVVGLFAGKTHSNTVTTTVNFDARGLYESATTSHGQSTSRIMGG